MLSLLNASLSPLRFPSSTSSHDFRGSSESDLVSDDDPVDAADPQLLSRRARKSSTRIAAARLLIVGEPPNPGAVAASKPTTRSCGSEFTRRSSASRSRLLRSEDARSSISRMNAGSTRARALPTPPTRAPDALQTRRARANSRRLGSDDDATAFVPRARGKCRGAARQIRARLVDERDGKSFFSPVRFFQTGNALGEMPFAAGSGKSVVRGLGQKISREAKT